MSNKICKVCLSDDTKLINADERICMECGNYEKFFYSNVSPRSVATDWFVPFYFDIKSRSNQALSVNTETIETPKPIVTTGILKHIANKIIKKNSVEIEIKRRF